MKSKKSTCIVNHPITFQPPSQEVHLPNYIHWDFQAKVAKKKKYTTYEKQSQLNQFLLDSLRVSPQ